MYNLWSDLTTFALTSAFSFDKSEPLLVLTHKKNISFEDPLAVQNCLILNIPAFYIPKLHVVICGPPHNTNPL